MNSGWIHIGPAALAAFLASLVEFVEALTIVLAVGFCRGWRSALVGAGAGLAALAGMIFFLGPALTRIPLDYVHLAVGILLLLFGLRWLRKSILCMAGVIPLHDEEAAFAKERDLLGKNGGVKDRWDWTAIGTAFNAMTVEGIEVVFIVIAIGATGPGLLKAASLGALAALAVVVALGLVLHRPISTIPENKLKFTVGILLSAFGTFWTGEGLGLAWPGDDLAVIGLIGGYMLISLATVTFCRTRIV